MLSSGAIFFILIVALLLATALAWLFAALYGRRLRALMRAAPPPAAGAAAAAPVPPAATRRSRWGAAIDFSANRKAGRRLLIAIALTSLLIAFTQAVLALFFVYTNRELSVNRVLVLSAVYAWPMALAWGLARRWSWPRIVGAVAVYLLAMLPVVMLRSNAAQTLGAAGAWLFGQVAVPLATALLIGASGRIRALAPVLLPPVLLLTGASVLTLQLVASSAQQVSPWLSDMAETLGAYPTLLLLGIAPWLILAWPALGLGRWLAAAYRAKRFSDLGYLIAVYWFVILFSSALPGMESVGALSFVQLLPWLWLPLLTRALQPALEPPREPPTLLVLRVFQRDAQVERLFDQVIERWRLTGNTVLIAGTDLISQTLDPDDLFSYFGGTLAERFPGNTEQIGERIADFDWRPDPDGRYRINECYCFDSTWQAALQALIADSDVVLMDLRGFQPENRGCRHELGVLARAGPLRRVVVLYDGKTALGVAQAEIGDAPPDRFHWLSAERMDRATADRVLTALFTPPVQAVA